MQDDFKLLSPAQWSPDAKELLKEHDGNAVTILMLGSCFPLSKETLQALTDEMAGILIDDWLEKQPPSVVAEHVRWWAAIVRRW